MKIVVVGLGHVGMPFAIILSQYYEVIAVDVKKSVLEDVKNRKSKFFNSSLLKKTAFNLDAKFMSNEIYSSADIIFICVPTNLDNVNKELDMTVVNDVLNSITKSNSKATIIIKSTVPIGFTEKVRNIYDLPYLFFSPEFLREEHEIEDLLYPSRTIIGYSCKSVSLEREMNKRINEYFKIMKKCVIKNDVPIISIGSNEAEAIKLFSNAYLALRIAYFNELDMYCEINEMDSKEVIKGVSLDIRIGDRYNNPSFGYGGYCLPKDTVQLVNNFGLIDANIIKSITLSNEKRKKFICNRILQNTIGTIGIYRLVSKKGATNLRCSSIKDILTILVKNGKNEIIIYEPYLEEGSYEKVEIINNVNLFKEKADLIVANRIDDEILDVSDKVYSRDLFFEN